MPVINEPQLQSRAQRRTDNIIITMGLAIFSFLLLLLTAVLWGAAGTYFYGYLFSPQYIEATVTMLIRLSILGFVVFMVMLLWSRYNLARYGNQERRHSAPVPLPEDTGKLFSVVGDQVILAQTFKSASLDVLEGRMVLCSYQGSCFVPANPVLQNK